MTRACCGDRAAAFDHDRKVRLYEETCRPMRLAHYPEQLLQSGKMFRRRTVIAGVAHELNNPLTADPRICPAAGE